MKLQQSSTPQSHTFDHGYFLSLLCIPDTDIGINATRDNLSRVWRPGKAHGTRSVEQHGVLQLENDKKSDKYGK